MSECEPTAGQRRAIADAALRLLRHNRRDTRHPRDGRRLRYTCPSPGHYPFQWFWDSCFHAIALAHLEPAAAREELELLVSVQPRSGFLPHTIFWDRWRLVSPGLYWAWLQSSGRSFLRFSALIQPPVLAAALEVYCEVTGDLDLVRRLLPAVDRYYGYLARSRSPGATGLITIVAPWESGMDHRPSYDAALGLTYPARGRDLVLRPRLLDLRHRLGGYRPPRLYPRARFLVQDVLVNAVYADGLHALAGLHERVADGRAERWRTAALAVEAAIMRVLRGCDGFFYDRDPRRRRLLPARTVAGLSPLLLRSLSAADAAPLLAALDNPALFGLPFPVPSVAADEPAFVPDELRWGVGPLLWRGPTWINTNWLLWRALRRRGDVERAGRIAAASAELVLRSGFREYYHPYTGAGLGAPDFGWSTLVVDMLARGV
jgi:hypothetical protein